MSRLARLQGEFLAALFDERPGAGGLEHYRQSVRAGLRGALEGAYPVVARLLGAAAFREAADRYVVATPSRRGDLHQFGASFGAFLERRPAGRQGPEVADVARLEWRVHRCLHADDVPPLEFEALARADPSDYGRLRLRLRPGTALFASVHPVLSIWRTNQPGSDGAPGRRQGGERVLVRREGHDVRPRSLDPREWALLRRLARGEPLGLASAVYGQDGPALEAVLARHAAEGLFSAFEFAPGTDERAEPDRAPRSVP